MSRKGFVSEKNRTVYFWSPKAACTTLFRTLVHNYGKDNKYYNKTSKASIDCIPYLEHGYTSAVLVRHPVDRIISAYLNKFVVYKGRKVTVKCMEAFARKLFLFHRNHFGGNKNTNDLSFEQFLDAVSLQHGLRSKGHDIAIDRHWDTQAPTDTPTLTYDIIAKVEEFPNDMKRLCFQTGIKYKEIVANRTKVVKNSNGYLGTVPANELNVESLSHDNFITEHNTELIKNVFRVDFDKFGYSEVRK